MEVGKEMWLCDQSVRFSVKVFKIKTPLFNPHTDWFPDKGEAQQLAVFNVFSRWFQHWSNGHAEAFNDVEASCCWVICLAPYHLHVGPYRWSGIPTLGPFPSALCLLIPLAHPSACTGSLFSLPALLRGLCGWESHNPSGLCVCTCCTLLCSSSCWGVSAEGTQWSQASCSNRLKEHVLCVWGQCVNTSLGAGAWTYCLCACFITSDQSSQTNELLHDPIPTQASTYRVHNIPLSCFIGSP